MKFVSPRTKLIILTLLIIPVFLWGCETKSEQDKPKSSEASVASSSQTSSQDQQQFKDAPDFTLKTMSGEPFTLSDHEGKVVVLNVWATWCPPCRKEIPDFIEIQEEMREEVLFVGVSVDKEGWEVVRPFAKEYDINYPLVVDDGTINRKYGPFRGIPTTFIINKKGKVEFVAPGMVSKSDIKPALEELASR
jgi:cytochrome c biogenesis protein CcmG/thiol:disulfide interchange protein DsbE